MSIKVLVGDVGGTQSRWAIYRDGLGPVEVRPTAETRTASEAVADWIDSVDACGIAVAGPVCGGSVVLTNADWRGCERNLGKPARLVNDLEAVAMAVPMLGEADLEWWTDSRPCPERVLCVGVGTGFGGALWTPAGVVAMEPGHEPLAGFDRLGRTVTVEEVVSGTAHRNLSNEGHDADLWLGEGFEIAIRNLVEKIEPEAIFLVGGVVEGRPGIFRGRLPGGLSVARISHGFPALMGAAAAAIDVHAMTGR